MFIVLHELVHEDVEDFPFLHREVRVYIPDIAREEQRVLIDGFPDLMDLLGRGVRVLHFMLTDTLI